MSDHVILSRLREIRTQIGLTQEDVARMADITSRTVQRLEAGHPTTVSTAKSISAVLMLPSYNELTHSGPGHSSAGEAVESRSESANDTLKQLIALKDAFVARRVAWVLSFAAMIMFYLTVPAGPWSQEHGVPLFVCFICALLPTIVMLVLTYEPEPPKPTHRFSLPGAALVAVLSAVGTMFAVWFSSISYGLLFETSLVANVFRQPVPPSMLDTLSNLHGAPWAVSFVMMAVSLALMTWLVFWLKARNVHFSRFSPACFMFIAVLGPISIVLDSVLLDRNPWLVAPLSAVVLFLSAIFVVFVERKEAGDWRFIKVSVLSGIVFLLVSSIVTQTANFIALQKVIFYRSAEVSGENKVAYCTINPENTSFCWDVRLLEQENIAVTPDNLMLLMARNGQSMSLMFAARALQINEVSLKDEVPFPDAFYRLISEGYLRMTLNAHEGGYLYDLIMLAQHEKENDEGEKYLSELAFKLGDGVEEFVQLVRLAKEDKPAFVKEFEHAHPAVKMNSDLKTLHFLATGKHEMYDDRGRHRYYDAGKASYVFNKSNGEQVDGDISLADVESIIQIDRSRFPLI